MNSKQKIVRLVGMIFVALAALFPPWQITVEKDGATQATSAGFRPLWDPPTTEVQTDSDEAKVNYRIHLILLGVELGIVLLVVNGAVYLLKEKTTAAGSE